MKIKNEKRTKYFRKRDKFDQKEENMIVIYRGDMKIWMCAGWNLAAKDV